jgi:hypothetical protein
MAKVDNLINECRKYTPLDGRVLVHALKIRQVKQEDYSFELDKESKMNEGKDPSKHRVDLKKVMPKINAKYQEAIVLQIPFDENRFSVGDTVVYPIGAINPFDLIKGVSVLRKYDIAAVVINNGIDEQANKSVVEVHNLLPGALAGSATTVSGYTV